MKIFKSIITAAFVFVTFLSCQKELAFDNNGVSTGSLKKDANGDCIPVTVNGIFKVDSLLNTAHFVDVQINVSNPGTFEILSDTVNGYFFSKTGNVDFGTNTVRLYASGKPIAGGTNTFIVKYGTSTCTFKVTVVGSGVLSALFTLGGSPSGCTGGTTNGTYTAGIPLTPSNSLTIQVIVITPGTYILGAASINGFLFTGSGVFTTIGLQNVTLTGTGTPVAAGISAVTVTNIASSCTFNISVLPAGGGSPAVYTLDGAPGSCTNFTINGTYTAGSATSISNTVTLQVNVTAIGNYNITTNTANGISFSKTGTFTLTGPQSVLMQAIGTPVAAGPFNFMPTAGASTCTFSVTCVAALPIPPGDYFPLTANSWWSYDVFALGIPQADTIFNSVVGTKTYNSNIYTEVENKDSNIPPFDTLHYRKSSNDYYQWAPTDFYSALFTFDISQLADILFLKENAITGSTWSSSAFSGTSGGVASNLRYDFKIENANTNITVNGINYTNVIYVSVAVQVSIMGLPYSAIENNEFYYAKGIGLVKLKYNQAGGGTVLGEANIRNYKVF